MKFHRFHSIEALESRIAPAGVVTVTYDAGTGALSLAGDAMDNFVKVFRTGKDLYRIEGQNGTVLDPGAETLKDIGKVTSLLFNGNDGGDSLTLVGLNTLASLTVNGGIGLDSVNLSGLAVKGAATFDLGGDGAQVSIVGDNQFGSDLVVNYGADGGSVSAQGDILNVKGGIILNGGNGGDEFVLGGTQATVGKGIKFTGGDGGNSLDLVAIFSVIGKSATGQAVQYTGGSGTDELTVAGSLVRLLGGVEFAGGGDANSVSAEATRLEVGGALKVTGGEDNDDFDWEAQFATFKGPVTFELGAGDNAAEFSGASMSFAAGVTYSGGADADSLAFGQQLAGDVITVKGLVTASLGAGTNSLQSFGAVFTLGAGLDVTGGAGDDNVDLASTITTTKGNVTATLGDGVNNFAVSGKRAAIGGEVRVTGGADGNTVQLNPGKLSVGKDVVVTLGAGDDNVILNSATLDFKKALTLTLGDGSDTVTIDADGRVKGDVSIDLGSAPAAGFQSLDVKSSSGLAGNLKLLGGLTVTSATAAGGGSLDFVLLQEVSVGKALTVTLGDADSDVNIENLFANDTVTINTGGGADVVKFEQGSFFGPSILRKLATINLGDGDDQLLIGISSAAGSSSFVRFLGGLSADGGANTAGDESNDFLIGTVNTYGVPGTRTNFEATI